MFKTNEFETLEINSVIEKIYQVMLRNGDLAPCTIKLHDRLIKIMESDARLAEEESDLVMKDIRDMNRLWKIRKKREENHAKFARYQTYITNDMGFKLV